MRSNKIILDYYREPSAMTDPGKYSAMFQRLPGEIEELVHIVQGLAVYRSVAHEFYGFNVPRNRENEIHLRSVENMLDQLLDIDSQELPNKRPIDKRILCLCRNFGLLLVSMLRAKNIPARIRCGYATYLIPDHFETHWICEYWDTTDERWKLVDAQLDETFKKNLNINFNALDIPRDCFLVVGDAWDRCRSRQADPSKFGNLPKQLSGWWHIAGNLIREIATLNKVETLSWDMWGGQPEADNHINEGNLEFFDELAVISRKPDKSFYKLQQMHSNDSRLKVPEEVFNPRTNAIEKVQ